MKTQSSASVIVIGAKTTCVIVGVPAAILSGMAIGSVRISTDDAIVLSMALSTLRDRMGQSQISDLNWLVLDLRGRKASGSQEQNC